MSKAITYYVDHSAIKKAITETEEAASALNIVLETFARVTGKPVDSMDDLLAICADAEMYYKRMIVKTSELDKKLSPVLKVASIDLTSLVTLPDDFADVIKATRQAERFLHFQSIFVLENGRVTPSRTFLSKIEQENSHSATTKEEKARLDICRNLIDIIKALEKEVESTFSEEKSQKIILEKSYALPLPHCLRIVRNGEVAEIIPDHHFITEGMTGFTCSEFYAYTKKELDQIEKMKDFNIRSKEPRPVLEIQCRDGRKRFIRDNRIEKRKPRIFPSDETGVTERIYEPTKIPINTRLWK